MKRKRELPILYKALIVFNRERIIFTILFVVAIYTFPLSLSDWRLLQALKEPMRSVQGEVVSVWLEREESEEDWPIYGYGYIFYHPEIGQYNGIGFGENIYLDVGQKILIDYNIENPHYNKATELDATRYSLTYAYIWAAAVFILTISIIFTGIRAIWHIKIIENGSLQMAKQKSKELFSKKNDGPNTYKHVYEYENAHGKKTTDSKVTSRTKRMKNKTPIAILSNRVVYIALLPKTVEKFILNNLMYPEKL